MLEKVIKYFEELSLIPRCSGYEQNAREWVIGWAKENIFKYKTDKVGNVIIQVPATQGMEGKETIVLQGHLDMVCAKKITSNHDFEKDPIKVIEKDGFLTVNKTTLGADNGIGIAIAMSMTSLKIHPKLEILATVGEEIGMIGALQLGDNMITGSKLINLDSETLGEIIITSAGGIGHKIENNYEEKKGIYEKYKINISGLKGGHSGLEIDKSMGNPIEAFMEFLEQIGGNIEFYYIDSGVVDNVIPDKLEGVVGIEKNDNISKKINSFINYYRKQYREDNFFIKLEKTNIKGKSIGIDNSKKLLNAILQSKNGVYKYSDLIEGFVQASKNLGILKLDNLELKMEYLIRSSTRKDLLVLDKKNKENFSKIAKVVSGEPFPGWVENKDSILLKDVSKIYKTIIGRDVKVLGVHAGLECGAIKLKMPLGSEIISIGPNIFGAHTVGEKCEIKSIETICEILEKLLQK